MSMLEQRQQEQPLEERGAETVLDPAIVASAASVVLSWYQFFVRDNREMGLFIGLWPPTILAFASYFNQTQMMDRLEYAGTSGTVLEAINRLVQGE